MMHAKHAKELKHHQNQAVERHELPHISHCCNKTITLNIAIKGFPLSTDFPQILMANKHTEISHHLKENKQEQEQLQSKINTIWQIQQAKTIHL